MSSDHRAELAHRNRVSMLPEGHRSGWSLSSDGFSEPLGSPAGRLGSRRRRYAAPDFRRASISSRSGRCCPFRPSSARYRLPRPRLRRRPSISSSSRVAQSALAIDAVIAADGRDRRADDDLRAVHGARADREAGQLAADLSAKPRSSTPTRCRRSGSSRCPTTRTTPTATSGS